MPIRDNSGQLALVVALLGLNVSMLSLSTVIATQTRTPSRCVEWAPEPGTCARYDFSKPARWVVP